MVTMHIKNKYEVSFKELIEQSEKKGGIPKHFMIDQYEAWDILNEMRLAGTASKCKYKVRHKDGAHHIYPQSEIFNSADDIDIKKANAIVKRWMVEEFLIYYEDIPIKIKAVPNKKKELPEPEKEGDAPNVPQPKPIDRTPKWLKSLRELFT